MIHEFKYKTQMMRWSRFKGRKPWIFAKTKSIRGYIALRLRGYYPHQTIFGKVLRKDCK
tara:strand:- start:566 stop:742 length:177 start_codon:yes stop_codon:yes gene_type:complete